MLASYHNSSFNNYTTHPMGLVGYYLRKTSKILFNTFLAFSAIMLAVPAILIFIPELPKFFLFKNSAHAVKSFEPTAHSLTGHNFYLPLNTGLIPVWHLVPPADYSPDNASTSLENMISGNRSIIFIVHGSVKPRFFKGKHRTYFKFLERGYHIITFDYKGFGENVGDTDGLVAVEETKAVYRWLRNKVNVRRIVVWCTSLGGAIAIEALRTLQPLELKMPRLVIESTFASTEEIVKSRIRKMSWFLLMITKTLREEYSLVFDSVNTLPKLKTDIYQMHSEADPITPYKHALIMQRAMHEAERNEKDVLNGTYRLKLYEKKLNLPHVIMSSDTHNCLDDLNDFLEMSSKYAMKINQNIYSTVTNRRREKHNKKGEKQNKKGEKQNK